VIAGPEFVEGYLSLIDFDRLNLTNYFYFESANLPDKAGVLKNIL
jgi:hypothetical protein